jgi:hypothetical protein
MNGTLPSSSTHSPYTSYPCISQPELHVEVRLVAPRNIHANYFFFTIPAYKPSVFGGVFIIYYYYSILLY